MNAHQEEEHPWLRFEKDLLAELLGRGMPLMGVCLGAQLLAEAAGATPRRASQPEIGWHEVEVTAEGAEDPLLAPLAPRFSAFQWHSYEAPLPSGATALARSAVCLNAYRIGEAAWGIQFHAEVSAADAEYWIADYRSDPDAVRIGIDPEALRGQTRAAIGDWNRSAASCAGASSTPPELLRRDVGGREAAVDHEGGGGHVGGLVAGQEQGGLGDLARPRRSAPSAGGRAGAPPSRGRSANSSWSSGVFTGPGQSAFTRTPRRANSTPSSRDSDSTPPFDAV